MAILIEDMRFHHDLHNLDVDLPNILLLEEGNNIYKRDFQKIYLFFDYERQDTFYSSDKIDKMMHIFNDETNSNGYIMI